MKNTLKVLQLAIVILFVNLFVGCSNKNIHSERITIIAEGMYDHFLKEDYYSFIDFMYPALVEKMGGIEKVVLTTKEAMNNMEANNSKILEVSFGVPHKLYKVDTVRELQCILPQILKMEIEGKIYLQKGYLIAISNDKGDTWTFMDTSAGGIETYREMFPNLHSSLKIPSKQKPKLIE